jgi:hypothetical protein
MQLVAPICLAFSCSSWSGTLVGRSTRDSSPKPSSQYRSILVGFVHTLYRHCQRRFAGYGSNEWGIPYWHEDSMLFRVLTNYSHRFVVGRING